MSADQLVLLGAQIFAVLMLAWPKAITWWLRR